MVGDKFCVSCETTKPLSEFQIGAYCHTKNCKGCNMKAKNWRYHNDPKFKERHKKQLKDSLNKERQSKYNKEWLQENKDWVRVRRQNYLPIKRELTKRDGQLLKDWVVRRLFANRGLKIVPNELIQLKRIQITAIRELKKQKHGSHQSTQSNV